jgi:hypothetical protein
VFWSKFPDRSHEKEQFFSVQFGKQTIIELL